VSFFQDGKKILETQPVAVTSTPRNRLGMVEFSFAIHPGKLTPGGYECQISVLDPVSRKASFWRGSLLIAK